MESRGEIMTKPVGIYTGMSTETRNNLFVLLAVCLVLACILSTCSSFEQNRLTKEKVRIYLEEKYDLPNDGVTPNVVMLDDHDNVNLVSGNPNYGTFPAIIYGQVVDFKCHSGLYSPIVCEPAYPLVIPTPSP